MNKVILTGRLGKEVESRTLENGTLVANFTMATSDQYKDKVTGEKKVATEWHNIVAWRKLAEIAKTYLKKGSLVTIVGKLQTRSWEKDGITRYTTEVMVVEIEMLGGGQRNEVPKAEETGPVPQTENDEMPF
jgi:single-strand DNA-binding protein